MLRNVEDLVHENHELMKDVSRLEDKVERLESLNSDLQKMAKKNQERVEALEGENYRLQREVDGYQKVIQDFCRKILGLYDLIRNQAEVIKALEKKA